MSPDMGHRNSNGRQRYRYYKMNVSHISSIRIVAPTTNARLHWRADWSAVSPEFAHPRTLKIPVQSEVATDSPTIEAAPVMLPARDYTNLNDATYFESIPDKQRRAQSLSIAGNTCHRLSSLALADNRDSDLH